MGFFDFFKRGSRDNSHHSHRHKSIHHGHLMHDDHSIMNDHLTHNHTRIHDHSIHNDYFRNNNKNERCSISSHEHEMVKDGRGVYAWIKKNGIFYNGDIPGVTGIMSVRMENSFEECFDKLSKNINESVSASFSSFRQDVSYDEIVRKYYDAEIVFIPIFKK